MREPLESAELLAFTETVEAGSLSRASAQLRVPRATLSRRLARLEQRLGARLLRRTTRSVTITDAGEALYRQARIALDAVRDAEASVRRIDTSVRGNLRVALPPLVSPAFLDVVAAFAAAYPEVRVQTHLSTKHVDLQRDGYDVALRASADFEPGLVARTLVRFEFLAVASPAYLEAHGTPTTLRDLRRHQCLMGFARGELPETYWKVGRRRIHLEGTFFSNSPAMLTRAAERGLGIALVPSLAVRTQLERGQLVAVMPGLLRSQGRIAVVYPERELIAPAVRAFVDWLLARAPTALLPSAPPNRISITRSRATRRPL